MTVLETRQQRRQTPRHNCLTVAALGGSVGESAQRRPVRAAKRLAETKGLGERDPEQARPTVMIAAGRSLEAGRGREDVDTLWYFQQK